MRVGRGTGDREMSQRQMESKQGPLTRQDPDLVTAMITIPQSLREKLCAIQRARQLAEGQSVTMSRIFLEAFEQYLEKKS
jgi:hypothetical protein